MSRHYVLLAALWFAGAGASGATDFVVTVYDDPVPDGCLAGDCSLREAVIAANSDSAFDRIVLSAGRYELTIGGTLEDLCETGDLDIFEDLEIVGPGATMTVVDGNLIDHVFHVRSELTEFTLRGVTVTGGNGSTGSGLSVQQATVVLEDCELRENGDGAGDHGMQLSLGASGTIRRTTVASNADDGIDVSGATLLLVNSTISGNANDLVARGDSQVTVVQTTIGGDATFVDVIVSDTGTIDFRGSLVDGDCLEQDSGSITSSGGNLESTGSSCGFDAASDQDEVLLPGLLALGDNGGSTRTRTLTVISPALDAVPNALCEIADQRGALRPLVADCDAGAIERSATRPSTPLFHDGFEQGHPGAWSDSTGTT